MNVGVIGAGWAGLSAAIALHDAGHDVSLYEAGPLAGGRARRVPAAGRAPLDNGQHIMLGAYQRTLQLMRRLHRDPDSLLLQFGLKMRSASGDFELRCRALPSPWHAVAAVALAKGWHTSEKAALLKAMAHLRPGGWKVAPDRPLAQWLDEQRQPAGVVKRFWEPLCLAALNTPLADASTAMMARVLKDSLDAGRHASDVLIPRTDLSDLWPDHLPADITLHRHSPIQRINAAPNGYTLNGKHWHDALVVAVPPPNAKRLLADLPARPGTKRLLQHLDAFSPVPIATLNLILEEPWDALHEPMLMLDDQADPGRLGQWLFNHAVISNAPDRHPLISIVISNCRPENLTDRETAGRVILEQVCRQTARFGPMPKVAEQMLIIEKRATFAATPGLTRPDNHTPWDNLALAGDWTNTGYPAVLEGAVISGQAAARCIG
ncbi:hydroxysqualene dehydroxylase HpnE [Pusillimonas minor]|uniref:FAD-dependent oxidoreductase n=1 Tax=Pusillimonas minor TaxID=2697024 RepID=A0A842HRE5_9BURK|nr:hydroxysqualene dehydroxylase HpnE [Pusillimonas minor]MBC2770833.1 FAD-dependent oxidoreductase [Pusillimonas minor]